MACTKQLVALGNIVASLLAFPLLDGRLAPSLSEFSPLMAAFAGVFAFEGVLSNTNVTVFGKGVLTIDDWIEKARSSAVEFAVERHARGLQDAVLKAAEALRGLPEDQLNAHLLRVLGTPDKLAEIETMAAKSGANIRYYKALILASQFPAQSAAVVRSLH
jgi:hypothetical protein